MAKKCAAGHDCGSPAWSATYMNQVVVGCLAKACRHSCNFSEQQKLLTEQFGAQFFGLGYSHDGVIADPAIIRREYAHEFSEAFGIECVQPAPLRCVEPHCAQAVQECADYASIVNMGLTLLRDVRLGPNAPAAIGQGLIKTVITKQK